MKSKLKFWILTGIAITYLAWTWYVSEPTYVSGKSNTKIESYDWVSVPEYGIVRFDSTQNQDVETGICLQSDGTTALIKLEPHFLGGSSDLTEVNIKSGQWRVIGKGTIYHKVNQYIGFNIFLISQILTISLLGLFIYKIYENA
jgi:hypothetical protein